MKLIARAQSIENVSLSSRVRQGLTRFLAKKAITCSRKHAKKINLEVKILKGEVDPKTVDLFRKLAKEAGPELCFDVDLPFSEQGFKDWINEIRVGDRIVAVAILNDQIIGTLGAVRGGLSFLPTREDGTLSNSIQTIRGFDLTAGYVSPVYRSRGLTGSLMGVELLKAALESKTPEEYVYATVSTGHYEETNRMLVRLFGWTLADVQAKSGTAEFFKMFEGLDGAKLTPEEVQTIQQVIRLGINPESAAIDVILKGLVLAGGGIRVGYSIDGTEPATCVYEKDFLKFYEKLSKI